MDNLEQNALWVIMDPWYPTPYKWDLEYCPNIDELNEVVLDRIIDYIPNLKHVCISCPLTIMEDDEVKEVTSHPKVSHLYNLENSVFKLYFYMKKYNLKSIVYCGFHYGRCILDKDDGAMNLSKHYDVWVKKDLCGLYPEDDWDIMDKETLKYAKII